MHDIICPFCGRFYGKPVEMTVTKPGLLVSYIPVSIECECGATYAVERPRVESCAE